MGVPDVLANTQTGLRGRPDKNVVRGVPGVLTPTDSSTRVYRIFFIDIVDKIPTVANMGNKGAGR